MLEDLETFLRNNASPEFAGMLEDADKVLNRLGIVSHETGIIQQLMYINEKGIDLTRIGIAEVYNERLDHAIIQHGIVLNTSDMVIKTDIVNGLLDIQNYEDADAISRIINSDDDPEGILSELLALVTAHDATDYHQVIVEVNPNLLSMLEILTADDIVEGGISRVIDELRKRTLWWTQLFPKSHAARLIADKTMLGLAVEAYLAMLSVEQIQAFENDSKVAGIELLGLLFISNTRDGQLRTKLSDLLDNTFSDLEHIIAANDTIDPILMEYLKRE